MRPRIAAQKRSRAVAHATGVAMIRRLRLASGLVMLAYVTMHLSNHAVGLISLDAMEGVLDWVAWVWSSRPGMGGRSSLTFAT